MHVTDNKYKFLFCNVQHCVLMHSVVIYVLYSFVMHYYTRSNTHFVVFYKMEALTINKGQFGLQIGKRKKIACVTGCDG